MAKISALPLADAATGDELVPVVQDGETRSIRYDALAADLIAAGQAMANYRATFADAVMSFEVGSAFTCDEDGPLSVYRRTAEDPFFTFIHEVPSRSLVEGKVSAADLASTDEGKGAEMVAFAQRDTGSAARTAYSKMAELPLSVEDFEGGDQAEKFSALCAALSAHGGGTVWLTADVYEVDVSTIPDNVHIGSTRGSAIRPAPGVAASATLLTCGSNVSFDGVTFEDPNNVLSDESSRFLNWENKTDIRVEDCVFQEMLAKSIRGQNVARVSILRNRFLNMRPHAKLSDENSCDISLVDNLTDIEVAGNIHIGADEGLWGSREIGLLCHRVTAGTKWSSLWIADNYYKDYRRFGIGVGTEDHQNAAQESNAAWIVRNIVINAGQQGIKTKAGSRLTLAENIVDGFEGICQEVPDSHVGGIYVQLNPDSLCFGNRVYGRRHKLWDGQCGTVSGSTIVLPESPPGTWTDATFGATDPNVNAVRQKHLIYDGQVRRIQSYDKTTRVATLNAAFSPAPTEGEVVEIWNNPGVGIFWQGNSANSDITWTDPEGATGFQADKNFAEGCEVGFLFSEPIFNAEFGTMTAHNCATVLRNRTAGTGTRRSRAINIESLQGHYIDYPNTIGAAAVNLLDTIDLSIGRLNVTGATHNMVQLQNNQNITLGLQGGKLEGAGIIQSGRSAILLNNNDGVTIGPVNAGGADAGAGQAYGLACTGANTGVKLIGTDLTGNATGAFNPSALPPADTELVGVKVGATLEMTDANTTYQPAANGDTVRLNVPITDNRTLALSTNGATDGRRVKIVRTAAATGAFTLNTSGPTDTVALNAGEWALYEYSSAAAAWLLVASGTV